MDSRAVREKSHALVDFAVAPINLPFPMAYGANVYVLPNSQWMIGFDYQRSTFGINVFSFEIGELAEEYYTVQARRFFGNSFNMLFGIGKRNMQARFPSDLFDLATHNYSETYSEMETRYIRIGLGNQWLWRGRYNISMDYFTLNIPYHGTIVKSASSLADPTNPDDKNRIEHAEDVLKYYPSLTAFHFNIGIAF